MKNAVYIVALLAPLISGCATLNSRQPLVYGLGDEELNLLGQRLGYRVDAMGMFSYSFTRGTDVFGVSVHKDITVARRHQADAPVVLTYDPAGPEPVVWSQFSIEHGVTSAFVEDQFRRFLHEMKLPATPPADAGERADGTRGSN